MLQQSIEEAVAKSLKAPVERLAAITAKGTQISAAAFFMSLYLSSQNLPPSQQAALDEVAARSRELGIQYLKLEKNRDIGSFIRNGTVGMREDN